MGRLAPASGHNLGVLSLVCFIAGGLLGWGAAQGGTRTQRVWPVVLRAQILLTSATLSLVAAWRLTSAAQLVGPLALADLIGLDVCVDILEVLFQGFGDPKYRACPLLRKYVAAGWLGRKSGRGFYRY